MSKQQLTTILMGRKEVRQLLGIGDTTLTRWIKTGKFPAPFRISPRKPLWPRAEIDAWYQKNLGSKVS